MNIRQWLVVANTQGQLVAKVVEAIDCQDAAWKSYFVQMEIVRIEKVDYGNR